MAADLELAGLAAPRLFAYPYGDHTSAVLRHALPPFATGLARLLLRRFGRQSAALAPLAAALASLADTPGGLLGLAA